MKTMLLSCALTTGLAAASVLPAEAATFAHWGPHGATYYHGYRNRGCCGGAVVGAAAGLAVGAAVGTAAASRPVYGPTVVYAPPPAVYAPRPYYYAY